MTITFFELLGSVIEREINFIADHLNKSVDEIYELIVEEAELNQAEWYSNRVPSLNYHSPACRLAYLYIVAAANSSTFQHVLESDRGLYQYVLELAKERHEIRICAFGAGPGTELLAMAKFFAQQNLGHSISVDFQLLDRVQEWMSSWYGIRDQINDSFRNLYGPNRSEWPMIPSGNFLACDVTQLDLIPYFSNVWGQDVYVINFLLSEVFNDDPGLRAFLSKVAEFAPSGARFVFIERRGYMWQNRMANIAAESGLLLSAFTESQGRLEEDPLALGDVYEVLRDERTPRLTWNIVYSIGVKQ